MVAIITVSDLPVALQSAELVQTMVDGANAKAARHAPCLAGTGENAPSEDQLAEARLVLVGAVKRWAESGAGAYQAQTSGPFGVTVDTRQRTGYHFTASEIEALRDLCASEATGRQAFSLDTVSTSNNHLAWCALAFGATYCSCGADLTNGEYPLFEGGVLSGDEY